MALPPRRPLGPRGPQDIQPSAGDARINKRDGMLSLIPLALALAVVASAGRGMNMRDVTDCNDYVSVCQASPENSTLYLEQINHFSAALVLTFVAAIVGPALNGCCKCNGKRCCACGSNLYSIAAVPVQAALYILLLITIVEVAFLLAVMVICRCPGYSALVVKDPLIESISENGKDIQLRGNRPFDADNLRELCVTWGGSDVDVLTTSLTCVAPSQGFFVQALLLCLFTCLVSIGYHVLVSLSRDVESKRQQHFERVRNGEFEMQPPPQAPPHYNIAQQWGPHYGQPPSYMQQQQPPIYYAHYNPQYSQQPGFAQGQAVNYHK